MLDDQIEVVINTLFVQVIVINYRVKLLVCRIVRFLIAD